jgi:hypothetical protein
LRVSSGKDAKPVGSAWISNMYSIKISLSKDGAPCGVWTMSFGRGRFRQAP